MKRTTRCAPVPGATATGWSSIGRGRGGGRFSPGNDPVQVRATVVRSRMRAAIVGYPDGRGAGRRRAEYLVDVRGSKVVSSTFGRGLNKWVTPKEVPGIPGA
jgi:hypothetical protein